MSGYVVPAAAFDVALDLLADRCTVVAVDHRGSGTSANRWLPTTTGTMAADALSVLDVLGLDSAHVVGVSLGGMVAQELAIGSPHRVRSLVLCSTTAGGPGAKTPPAHDIVGELRSTAARVPGGLRPRPWGAFQQACAAATHDATGRLQRIQAATLVVHGQADELVPVANATWLASRIAGAELRIVRRGTHLLMLESPSARAALHAWLDLHLAETPAAGRPDARAQLGRFLEGPYRLLLGQSLPLRRTVRAGSRLVRRSCLQRGPGTP